MSDVYFMTFVGGFQIGCKIVNLIIDKVNKPFARK